MDRDNDTCRCGSNVFWLLPGNATLQVFQFHEKTADCAASVDHIGADDRYSNTSSVQSARPICYWNNDVGADTSPIWLGLSANDAVERRGIFIWLGRISYGVYAIHFPIYRLVIFALAGSSLEHYIQEAPLLLACVLGMMVIAAAHLITSVVDEPLRRWWLSIHVVRPAI
jgi:hypothetical protein